MIYDFTADDVFEIAEQLERNGNQFYREAAQNTDNAEYKKLLAEKDSIVFYLGIKEMVPEKYGKDKLDKIIKEEMGHIKLLSKELVALKNQ